MCLQSHADNDGQTLNRTFDVSDTNPNQFFFSVPEPWRAAFAFEALREMRHNF